ncbi:MAG: DUF4435 domain-containing protein [Bacteroidales bacterium]
MHSVKNSIKQDSQTATLVQMFRTDLYSEKIIVVVEGEDDKRLFSRFFQDETAHIFPIGGNVKFPVILNQLNGSYETRFIMLKDADFDHLNKTNNYPYSNLFLTDTHDAETMMINYDTIRNICCEYSCPIPPSEFIEKLFRDLEALSYLKWYNSVNNIRLNFKVLNLTNIYTGDNPTEFENILSKLYANDANKSKIYITKEDIQLFYISHKESGIKPQLLINGHDLCEAMVVALIKMKVKGNVKNNDISRCLRSSYTLDHFKETKMYEDIFVWNKECQLDILCS